MSLKLKLAIVQPILKLVSFFNKFGELLSIVYSLNTIQHEPQNEKGLMKHYKSIIKSSALNGSLPSYYGFKQNSNSLFSIRIIEKQPITW